MEEVGKPVVMDMKLPDPRQPVIVAVSGGVDSVVLLHLLTKAIEDKRRLVVAHFDHGIRTNSADDKAFVEQLALKYGLPFESAEGKLGPDASEDQARRARYDFLETVRKKHGAQRVVTAHHQDDLIETAAMNLLRGTGRRGLTSLKSTHQVWRPLLGKSKEQIKAYARDQGLVWQEDETNADTRYRRNYIRHVLIPSAQAKDPQFRQKMLNYIAEARRINREADAELDKWVAQHGSTSPFGMSVQRHAFINLNHQTAREVMMDILRRYGARDVSKKQLERLTVAAKTAAPGTSHDVCCHVIMRVYPSGRLDFSERKPVAKS